MLAILLVGTIIPVPAFASGMDDFQLAFYDDIIQDIENNTSIPDAQDIKSGQTVLGRMRLPVSWKGLTLSDGTLSDDYMDMDYFRFTLTQDSSVFVCVFPEDYQTDDYMIATISDASDATLARTESYETDDGGWFSAIYEYPLSAGTYYITFLNAVDSTKYNDAKYMGYFEAVPKNHTESSGNEETQQSTTGGTLSNFTKENPYTAGQFTDVSTSTWCADNVQIAYEYGLMAGKSDSYFDTEGNLTIAQALVMACRLHNIYYGNNYAFQQNNPWYQDYVNYAIKNGIIESGYENYDVPVSRAGFAIILNGALPNAALQQINTIEDQSIPDVPDGSNYYDAVYRLYRAGVLTGNDSKGTFAPFSYITRGAAAAIVSRMADTSLRKNITLHASHDPMSITLSATSQTIYVKNGYSLTATVLPENATDKTVTWTSSNRAVATVEDGYVYGIAPGTATITARTVNGKTATCTITVVKETVISDSYLAQKAYDRLKSVARFPETLKIYNIWAYDLNDYRKIEIDFSAADNYGRQYRSFYVVTFLQDGTLYLTDQKASSPHKSSGFLGTNLREVSISSIKR